MSGRRCKAIRAAFKKKYGRSPHKAGSWVEKSEWRVAKKEYKATK